MQPTNQAIPTLMTTRQLFQALALSCATVHRARKAGRITPAIVMSRAVRWDPRLGTDPRTHAIGTGSAREQREFA